MLVWCAQQEQLINDTKELLKVLNLFREKHGSRRDPNNVGAVSLIAAYEVLNPKKTLPELMGLTTGEYIHSGTRPCGSSCIHRHRPGNRLQRVQRSIQAG